MIGPEGAAANLAAWLTLATPAKLAELVDRLDLDAEDLPAFKLITDQPRPLGTLSVNEYPALFVVVQAAEGMELLDIVDGGELYLVRYPVRLFLFARGGNFVETDLRRKRYVLALRELVLTARQSTGIDAAGYRESYSDVSDVPDKEIRTVAGAFIEATAAVEETLNASDLIGIGAPTYPAPEPDGWATELTEDLIPHPAEQ